MFEEIKQQSEQAALEFVMGAKLQPGQLVVIGCSSSEMVGERIGKGSSLKAAQASYEGMAPVFQDAGIHIAAQCCEHLNRALVVEKAVAEKFGFEIVNAIPQPDAGGSFPVTVYERMAEPVLVEEIMADAGIDIGGTFIGMHLKKVAVPLRLSLSKIGQANILCARTRPKFIGGARAKYLER